MSDYKRDLEFMIANEIRKLIQTREWDEADDKQRRIEDTAKIIASKVLNRVVYGIFNEYAQLISTVVLIDGVKQPMLAIFATRREAERNLLDQPAAFYTNCYVGPLEVIA